MPQQQQQRANPAKLQNGSIGSNQASELTKRGPNAGKSFGARNPPRPSELTLDIFSLASVKGNGKKRERGRGSKDDLRKPIQVPTNASTSQSRYPVESINAWGVPRPTASVSLSSKLRKDARSNVWQVSRSKSSRLVSEVETITKSTKKKVDASRKASRNVVAGLGETQRHRGIVRKSQLPKKKRASTLKRLLIHERKYLYQLQHPESSPIPLQYNPAASGYTFSHSSQNVLIQQPILDESSISYMVDNDGNGESAAPETSVETMASMFCVIGERVQATHSDDGVQATHSDDGVQATHSDDGVQATHSDDGVQATHSDDGVQATHSDDGVQATHSDDGVQATHSDDGVQATHSDDGNSTNEDECTKGCEIAAELIGSITETITAEKELKGKLLHDTDLNCANTASTAPGDTMGDNASNLLNFSATTNNKLDMTHNSDVQLHTILDPTKCSPVFFMAHHQLLQENGASQQFPNRSKTITTVYPMPVKQEGTTSKSVACTKAKHQAAPKPDKLYPVRDYVKQAISRDLDDLVIEMLGKLMMYQERSRLRDPSKAKSKLRLVLGIRQVLRGIRAHKIKCIVMARNIEQGFINGGVDDKVNEIITLAGKETDSIASVPVVFALTRHKLRESLSVKKGSVSVVGIYNADGAHEELKKILTLVPKLRSIWKVKVDEELVHRKWAHCNRCDKLIEFMRVDCLECGATRCEACANSVRTRGLPCKGSSNVSGVSIERGANPDSSNVCQEVRIPRILPRQAYEAEESNTTTHREEHHGDIGSGESCEVTDHDLASSTGHVTSTGLDSSESVSHGIGSSESISHDTGSSEASGISPNTSESNRHIIHSNESTSSAPGSTTDGTSSRIAAVASKPFLSASAPVFVPK